MNGNKKVRETGNHKPEFNDMNTGTPTVSVVIPTYNRGWILKEAIDSVLSQDCDCFELIVVDDGSTDNTQEILSSYRDRIKVIRQENKGVSAARNKGIDSSSGTYIAFLDSDDLWLPGKLETQLEFFRNNPDALICQTEEIWVRTGRRVNPGKRHKKVSGFFFEKSLELCMVSPSAVMMKSDLFDKSGLFDETLPACEDYDMWLRINCRYPIHLIDTLFIVKRGGHKDQLSRMHSLDKHRIRSIKKLLEGDLLTEDQRKLAIKAMTEKCLVYAEGCRKRGRKDEALDYMKLAEVCPISGSLPVS
jgi:glycosyltransferase involved in cell wall biosynthesis